MAPADTSAAAAEAVPVVQAAEEDDPPPPICEVAPLPSREGVAAEEIETEVEEEEGTERPMLKQASTKFKVAGHAVVAGSRLASPKSPMSLNARLTDDSCALQIQQFLDEWHFGVIHSKLGKTWTRKRVLIATLQIFELNGMEITAKDHEHLVGMDENAMIYDLVDRMPEELRTNIEVLGEFLQKVLHAVCDVRRVIDDKRYDDLQDVLAGSDSMISQELLKQGVVRGAHEVRWIHRCRDTWTKNMNARLARLTNSSELAEHASQQLLAVESQLEAFMGGNKEKNTQMLGGIASKNDKLLQHSVFAAWNGFTIKQVAQGNLRRKYQDMAVAAEDHLVQYREKRILTVRNVLMRKAGESDSCLLALCVETWGEDIAERKKDGDQKALLLKMQQQLNDSAQDQKENTKRVMARMSADSDGALVSGCFGGWIQFHASYAKDKELEDAVKVAERQVQEYLAKKKKEATGVLDRMNASTDAGLVEQMFQYWTAYIKESAEDRKREAAIADKTMHFQSMRLRQSGNAQGIQTRVSDQKNANLLLTCLGGWQLESKVNRVGKYYTNKIESKRKQLSSVQNLFKSFAAQLEQGLANVDGEGSEPGTARVSGEKPRARKESVGGRPSSRSSHSGVGESRSLPQIQAR